jgi:hypothetical protein
VPGLEEPPREHPPNAIAATSSWPTSPPARAPTVPRRRIHAGTRQALGTGTVRALSVSVSRGNAGTAAPPAARASRSSDAAAYSRCSAPACCTRGTVW